MNIAVYTNIVSPHQLPLASSIMKLCAEGEFAYVYTQNLPADAGKRGWTWTNDESWMIKYSTDVEKCARLLIDVDGLIGTERDVELYELRANKNSKTAYMSERWFKPSIGMLRLLSPKYLLMAWRFVRMLRKSDQLWYLPIGIHAARDMARLCGLFAGDWRCLFRAPKLDFERKPGGRIWISGGARSESVRELGEKYCLDKMRMWGYFVESSSGEKVGVKREGVTEPQSVQAPNSQLLPPNSQLSHLRILWVGRLLDWKRVDTIIKAVGALATNSTWLNITLDIYGMGPEEKRLKKLAAKYGEAIKFHPPVPIAEVRKLMREHDVYVLSSNGYEGWGAVVSEALEEGMKVIGTYEAGSSATILPESNLFHAGDWPKLAVLLKNEISVVTIDEWIANNAARILLKLWENDDAKRG